MAELQVKKSVGEMLRKLMSYYGLTQKELAAKFRFDNSQVSRWINGKSSPRVEEYLRIRMEFDEIKDKKLPMFQFLSAI